MGLETHVCERRRKSELIRRSNFSNPRGFDEPVNALCAIIFLGIKREWFFFILKTLLTYGGGGTA